MAGRPPLRIGSHGKISRKHLGDAVWLARCRYRDCDGVTRIVERRGPVGDQYGKFEDAELNKMYDAMNRTGDEAEQKRLMRAYEKRVLDEQAYNHITLWWYRIIAHRSYMKGWKITPSHYLNQDLSGVWLDK